MRSLARGQIPVQFGDVFKNRHAGQRLDDFKDLLDLRLKMNERRLPSAFFELFAGVRKHPETGAADKLQVSKVEDDFFDLTGHDRSELAFQVWRGGGVEAAGESDGDGASGLAADVLLDLDFEWHIGFGFCVFNLV